MDYQKHYNSLILKAQHREKPKEYCEQHHIVPKSLGGTDEKNNFVFLTAREHFIAHLLLAHIFGGTQWCAVVFLSRKFSVNSKHYEMLRRKWNENMSGKNSPMFGKKRDDTRKRLLEHNPMHNVEIAKKQGNKMKGNKNPMWGKFGGLNPSARKIKVYFSKGNVETFNSVKEFSETLKIARTNISNWLAGTPIPKKYNIVKII
jgi:hypothetical protein